LAIIFPAGAARAAAAAANRPGPTPFQILYYAAALLAAARLLATSWRTLPSALGPHLTAVPGLEFSVTMTDKGKGFFTTAGVALVATVTRDADPVLRSPTGKTQA
jgi:hypothetical protein